jgi:hypothetical protein
MLVTTVIVLTALFAHAQVFDYRLKMADSLYVKKQYTQSLELYREIFQQHSYSPAMLLKMAYIEEGLGQNSLALYYINLYYEATHDDSALNKMEDMATKYNLKGYEFSRTDHTFAVIMDNKNAIITVLAAICLMLVAIMIYTVRKKKMRPYVSFSLFMLFVLLLIGFTNRDLTGQKGIILNAPTYVMSGPSPGAKVVGIISEGNRVPIRGRHDVWVKVQWAGKNAYVKENQVLEVKL